MISIVIPFFDEQELINRAVLSVFLQDFKSEAFEILICNDGILSESEIKASIDDEYVAKVRVLKNHYSKGPGGARNTGLDASVGDYIAFLDADDFWLPGKVDAQLAFIRAGATFVATAYRFDTNKTVLKPPAVINKSLDIFLRRGIGTSTVMITRALGEGLRFKDIRFAQDIDFWYLLACSPYFRYAAIETCFVEYSTGGSTKNKWVQLQYLHMVLCINKVPFISHIRVLTSYVLAGVFNHYIKRLFS